MDNASAENKAKGGASDLPDSATCDRCGITLRPVALTTVGWENFRRMVESGMCARCRAEVV